MTGTKDDGLLKHGFLLMAATQIANVSNILYHVAMGRALDDSYSTLLTMLNLMLIVGTPMEAVRTATAHFAARAVQAGDRGAVLLLLRTWGLRLLGLGLLLTAMTLVFRAEIAAWFHFDGVGPVLVTAITLPGLLLVPMLAGALQGLQSFVWMSLGLQALSILRLAGGAAFVWWIRASPSGGLCGQTLGVAAALGVGCWGLSRLLRRASPARMDLRGTGGYLGRSLVALSAFAVLMMMDVLLVKHYVPGTAEDFARAATVARSVIFLPMPIALAMFPKVVSAGHLTPESRRIFWKALALVGGLVLCGVGGCLLLPGLPLKVLYGVATPEAERLVRWVVLAMTPVSLVYLLLNFEMAQHRFRSIPLLWAGALLYVVGSIFCHGSAIQITWMLAAGSTLAAAGLCAGMPWKELIGRRDDA